MGRAHHNVPTDVVPGSESEMPPDTPAMPTVQTQHGGQLCHSSTNSVVACQKVQEDEAETEQKKQDVEETASSMNQSGGRVPRIDEYERNDRANHCAGDHDVRPICADEYRTFSVRCLVP